MSNKQIEKIPVDKNIFMNILKEKGLSLRGLDKDENFKWSDKTLRRGLNDGQMSKQLIDSLTEYLNIEASSFAQIKTNDKIKKSSVTQTMMLDLNIYDVDVVMKNNKIQIVWTLKKNK